MRWIALLLFCVSCQGIELDSLTLNYQRFNESNRIPDLEGFKANEGLNLGVDLTIWKPFYWNNRIVSFTDQGSYRLVGWNSHIGVRVFDCLKIEYEHFSKHILDHTDHDFQAGKFPVQDSIGFVLTIYENNRRPSSIF